MTEVVNNTADHRFEITMGRETAFAEYQRTEDGLVLPHTVVPEALGGHGVGGKLAVAALGYARQNDLKVIPTCSFIAGYMAKHPETHDLVHPDYRARIGLS